MCTIHEKEPENPVRVRIHRYNSKNLSSQEVYEFHLQASRASINVPEGARSEKSF